MHTLFMFRQAFHHERRLFGADRLILLVVSVLLAACAYGVFNAQARVDKTGQAVAAAHAEEQVRLAENRANLGAMLKGEFVPKTAFANPANPLWIGNRHGATYAVLPPAALAATAVGQSDLNPSYVKISADSRDTFSFNDEIENPGNLLIGQFDLAFFIVFLLPLVIIALSYNLLSSEREQGTLPLLLSNPLRLATVLGAKLAFRAGLVLITTIVVTIAALALAGAPLFEVDGLRRMSWWCALVVAYGAFWFALSAAVNATGKSSASNVIVLVGCWIVFALVLPTLFSIIVNVMHPVPSRTEMINTVRSVQTGATRSYDASAARFKEEHEAMEVSTGVLSGKDFEAARKRVIVQQTAARDTDALMAGHAAQLARQQSAVDLLRFASPPILMQEALNDVAGTGEARYRHFSMQVDQFYTTWQAFFTPRVISNTPLTLADYASFPRFQYAEQASPALQGRLVPALLGLLLPALLLAVFTARAIRRYPVSV